MATIQNPILPGFHPDPSMIRVGEDYYIAVSSFEWFPGVPIYHSKDLVHWELLYNVLDTKEKLPLTGLRPSWGVWAPNLSYSETEQRFYLVYSIVTSNNKWFFDVDNYLLWTDDINGQWQGPAYLNSSGFDPALFHDDDGRKWIVNKDRDFRPTNIDDRTIVVQELDINTRKLLGEPVSVSSGATRRGFVEGAQLMKHEGWYYLITAEGGTGYGHCVAVSRSRQVTGPYEACPHGPVLTSTPGDFVGTEKEPFMMFERYNPETVLQKAGHGSLIETTTGEWYMAHLCGRPLDMHCVLGRETALQRMDWTPDGWPCMADGTNIAKDKVQAPKLLEHRFPERGSRETFSDGALSPYFYTPRNVIHEGWAKLSGKGLSLRGQESLCSNYNVSLIARKLTGFHTVSTTKLQFTPTLYHHLAGVTCYYASQDYYSLFKTWDQEKNSAVLRIYGFIGGALTQHGADIPVLKDDAVWLRVTTDNLKLTFAYSTDGERFLPAGEALDLAPLSDERCSCGTFTGTFVGMFAQDSYTREVWADFNWFDYKVLEEK